MKASYRSPARCERSRAMDTTAGDRACSLDEAQQQPRPATAPPSERRLGAVTILDGGMGRQLLALGAPFRQPEWSALALMEAPHFVRTAHDQFVAAGAQHSGTPTMMNDGACLLAAHGRTPGAAAQLFIHMPNHLAPQPRTRGAPVSRLRPPNSSRRLLLLRTMHAVRRERAHAVSVSSLLASWSCLPPLLSSAAACRRDSYHHQQLCRGAVPPGRRALPRARRRVGRARGPACARSCR